MTERLCKIYQKYRQLILYVFFGACTTVVGVGSFTLFDSVFKIHELLANVYSWVLAVGFAYITNRKWVFHSQAKGKALGKELVSFYAGRLMTLGLEEAFLLVLVTWLAFPSTAVKLVAQVSVLVGNYILSKLWIFHKK